MKGMNKAMSEILKLAILYDRSKNVHSITNHNLTGEEAERLAATNLEPSLVAISVEQKAHHRTSDPQACRACRSDVARASGLQPKPKFKRRKESATTEANASSTAANRSNESITAETMEEENPDRSSD